MGLEIENLSAAQAVRRVMELLDRKPLSVCALLRADMLLQAEEHEEYQSLLSQLSLGIIGDSEILHAMGEMHKERQKEVETNAFLDQFLQALSREGRTVAILAETEGEKNKAMEELKRMYPSLSLVGAFSMELSDDADDAVNHINGLDAEIVLAKLSSPGQEEFAFANRSKLNVSLWLGLGRGNASGKNMEKVPGFFEKLLVKRLFKKKVTRYQDEKN